MHWLSPFFYMEAKFGPLKKKDKLKQLTTIELKFFRRTAARTFFDHNEKVLEELKVEPADQKLRRYKLAATCNKNGQQQDGKNSAELQTRWTKTT